MSITLTLNGDSSLLSANYFPPIQLNENYVCGLISFDTYHSIPNVDVENNLFHIGDHEIEIPVGSYEISDIAEFLKNKYYTLKTDILSSKLHNLNGSASLDIKANYNTLQTQIKSASDIIYFNRERSIGSLLGFSKRVLQPDVEHFSDKPIDITKINTIIVESNIVSGSFINDTSAHILHQFSLNVSPGYKITEAPANVIYLPVRSKTINSIALKVVDQDGNLINFRGEKISVRLHLKPART